MSTTTIRLPDELKGRLAKVAKRLGSSPHALILDAIAERVSAEETRNSFVEEANARYEKLLDSGKSIPWDEMKRHLKARASGQKASPAKSSRLDR